MRLILLVFSFAVVVAASEPVRDEATCLRLLQILFPRATIAVSPDRTLDLTRAVGQTYPISFPDTLAGEAVYTVSGIVSETEEFCAATSASGKRVASARELRFRAFRWPGQARQFIVILQYRFPNARPRPECASVAVLANIAESAWIGEDRPAVLERVALPARFHTGLQSVKTIDLTGDGIEELWIESDSGTEEAAFSEVYVYGLADGSLRELLSVQSRFAATGSIWQLAPDLPKTLRQNGKRFCFVKTVYASGGRRFPTPEISNPCFPSEYSWRWP